MAVHSYAQFSYHIFISELYVQKTEGGFSSSLTSLWLAEKKKKKVSLTHAEMCFVWVCDGFNFQPQFPS